MEFKLNIEELEKLDYHLNNSGSCYLKEVCSYTIICRIENKKVYIGEYDIHGENIVNIFRNNYMDDLYVKIYSSGDSYMKLHLNHKTGELLSDKTLRT